MKRFDLNCDMGESFGSYTIGMDHEVIKYITSANIACGFHAGDPRVMNRTVETAKQNGVGAGAHPGFPDLNGFGRRFMDASPDEVITDVMYQVGALKAFCAHHGVRLQHVKPHGALYLAAVGNEDTAKACAEAVLNVDPDLIFVALAGAKGERMRKIGEETGLKVAYEAFPDRAYTSDGNLASRKIPGAVIKDPKVVAERAVRMASEGKVVAVDGYELELEAQTLCVHGDNPTAVSIVKNIREALEAEGIILKPMGEE